MSGLPSGWSVGMGPMGLMGPMGRMGRMGPMGRFLTLNPETEHGRIPYELIQATKNQLPIPARDQGIGR